MICDEALNLIAMEKIRAAEKHDDAGFNSFFKTGWKRFYLKWYDASHPSAERFCPQTVALLRQLPSVKAAMFAELPPGSKLNRHRDPFAGSLRHHLGLSTPNDDRCFIEVDGERYSWRDGQGVVFDETYIHCAQNDSQTTQGSECLGSGLHTRHTCRAHRDSHSRIRIANVHKPPQGLTPSGEAQGRNLQSLVRQVFKAATPP